MVCMITRFNLSKTIVALLASAKRGRAAALDTINNLIAVYYGLLRGHARAGFPLTESQLPVQDIDEVLSALESAESDEHLLKLFIDYVEEHLDELSAMEALTPGILHDKARVNQLVSMLLAYHEGIVELLVRYRLPKNPQGRGGGRT